VWERLLVIPVNKMGNVGPVHSDKKGRYVVVPINIELVVFLHNALLHFRLGYALS